MKPIGEKIKWLRTRKNITQESMGEAIGLKLTTYAAREAKGKFSDLEMSKILRKLGINKEEFEQIKTPGNQDLSLSLPESLILIDAKLDISLSVLAELLAKQSGQSVTGTVNDLTKAVKEQYEKRLAELSR